VVFDNSSTPTITELTGTVFALATPASALPTPSFANLTPSQLILFGIPGITLSGTLGATGGLYPAQGETITVTIDGQAQTTTINDGTGDFSFTYNPSTIPVSGTPYTITYSYAGDASLNLAANNSTTLTVNPCTPPVAGPSGLAVSEGQSVSLPVAAVLLGDSAPAGGTLSISGVVSPTGGGATVTLADGAITYTPAAGFSGADTIAYTLNDGLSDGCASVPGTIAVAVAPSGSPPTAQVTAPAGQTATVAAPPAAGQGGVTAALNNVSGSQSVTVTAALYSGNPISGSPTFGLGTTYLDLGVSGATASDSMTAYFYSPYIVPAPALEYYTGSQWENVQSDVPPPGVPAPSL
jgi:hypothetical protein